MQMLIDKEMSKQKDSKHYLPNVVAKLMGLETLPRGEPSLSMERSYRSAYPQQMNAPVGFPFRHWQQEDRFMDREILHEVHPSTEQVAYKEMYEIWQQSQRARHDRGRWSEDVDEKRMALIRQKFIEAKHLSTDERMRQSKQFKDALEVLSSNSDLLMRLLDSQNVYEFYSSRRTDTKRITLIKPLKMDDNDKPARKEKRNNRLIKKSPNVDQAAGWENTNSGNSPDSQKVDESPVRTTRIVLLKPSPGRTPEQKDAVSPTTTSPPNLRSGNCHQGPEYDDAIQSIRVAKEITQQMHKGLWSYQKDKTPHYSSVISNGYSDDESSFNKSYHEYASANFSDLEATPMSPLPRLSWDYNYINGCSSPYSTMSLGRVPCSPESSVCREAKKRLSERWTMMTSDKGPQEQTKVRRNSTLGEMLSLTHMKKSAKSVVESIQEDQEPGKSVSCSHSFNAEISIEGSPKNLPRFSVPASSTVNGTELTVQVDDSKTGKSQASRAQTKSKSRPTFKEKVASLLFSKSKKSTKEKPSSPESKDESQPAPIVTEALVLPAYAPEVLRDDESQIINVDSFEEFSLVALCESSEKTSTNSVANRQEEDMITLEPGLAVAGSMMLEINSSQSPDQPSPFSVLQPPFEDDNNNVSHESLDRMKNDQLGSQVELKSNLIDKSPPIESIARTLSWDDSCAEVASPHLLKPLMVPSLDSKIEEKEWLLLVHNLLSAAGLDDQQQYDSFYTRWYSLESPLDPSLRDTLLNEKEPQPMHEGRRRKMRSKHRSLRHPNIIRFKEVLLTPTHLAIVLEYASGGELFERICSAGRFSEDEARYFFQQLISGVSYCHSMEICHRDLKLENTLLDGKPSPRLKICDFGYSKSALLHSQPKSTVGTPAYIAPEVLSRKEYDGKISDVWSCGVTLYVMLVGAYPFEDPEDPRNFRKTIGRIIGVQYSIPDYVRVSSECRNLLSSIFVADPAKRITIPEIKQNPWFLKNLPKEIIEAERKGFEETKKDQPSQKVEEIMKIIQEARVPGEGSKAGDGIGGQGATGSLDIEDIEEIDVSGDYEHV